MTLVDKELEKNMEAVLDIVQNGRAARNGAVMKNRQPLAKMFVKCDFTPDDKYYSIIEEELNVKAVEFVSDMSELISYSFKPQLKTVGPKYGKHLGAIREWLANIDGTSAKKELDTEGFISLVQGEDTIKLYEEDLLIDIKQKEGYYTFSDKGTTVTLDTNLTPELVEEGIVREIVSKIQTMRKEAGFEVMDHIYLGISGNDKLYAIADKNKEEIFSDVLALDLKAELSGYEKEWDINGDKVTLSVEKA
jgi:isoleucyl-tRNA synthetase